MRSLTREEQFIYLIQAIPLSERTAEQLYNFLWRAIRRNPAWRKHIY